MSEIVTWIKYLFWKNWNVWELGQQQSFRFWTHTHTRFLF